MPQKAILVVSFGTTKEETRQKTIEVVEKDVQNAFPQYTVRRAYTSKFIIERLKKRGIEIESVSQALASLKAEGVEDIFILPTYLLPGEEYQKMQKTLTAHKNDFRNMITAKPLLYEAQDLVDIAAFLKKTYALQPQEALFLMAHGSTCLAHEIYERLLCNCREMGAKSIFLAAVEGKPSFEAVLEELLKEGYTAVKLVPLLLTAGTHVVEDLAGESGTSWKNQCKAAGLEVSCVLSGLGEAEEIRQLYLRHLRECIEG